MISKALILENFNFESLKIDEIKIKEELLDDEVLIKLKALSLNHIDVWVITGSYPKNITLPHVIGSDGAGIVVKTGKRVKNFKEGDEVIIYPALYCGFCDMCVSGNQNLCEDYRPLGTTDMGIFSEYFIAKEINLVKKPPYLSFEESASLGIAYLTALHALKRAKASPGKTIYVEGATGGVGTATLLLSKLFSMEYIGFSKSEKKAKKLLELGASKVISSLNDIPKNSVDIALDNVGKESINRSLSTLKRGGILITLGSTTGQEANINLRYIFGKNISIIGIYMGTLLDFRELIDLSKYFKPYIDSVFKFEEFKKAYDKLISRDFIGKIVLSF